MADREPEGGAFFDGFLDDYFAECDEHLTGARRVLLTLEESVGRATVDRPALDELFRVFHSLKGISAMVELRPAETLAHDLESYLRTLRERGAVLSADGIDVLFQGTQRLDEIIAAHRAGRPQHDLGDIVGRIEQLLAADPSASPRRATHTDPTAASSRPRWRCSFAPTREMLARGIGVDAIRKRLAAIGTIVQATPHVGPDGDIRFDFELLSDAGAAAFADLRADGVIVTEVEEPRNPMLPESSTDAAARADAPAMASHVVRVDLKRLDDLMQNVGDLVISRARLGESLARLEPHVPPLAWRAVQDNTIAIDRQLRTLRENIMRVRLVPVGEIFRRMPFVVRDLARDTGKRVRLELRGQSTEIDKFVVERMMDPVLHLVRNAVSHGIELPDERIRAGKPPDATLTLSASTAGEFVRMEIADDGRGIDAERVLARAAAHGLAVPAGTPDHGSLLALICSPGFSTKDDTDRASGRGVGMAVVKAAVEELSGTLTLDSEPGAGTRFIIELPLTLAIADALIVRVGSETFAVPQSAVREVIEVAASDLRTLEHGEIMSYRGGALPILRLSQLFGLEGRAAERFHAFVIGHGPTAVAIAVDRIVGQREIVVRTIADPLVKAEGVAGATDLGDGAVVLILDPAALARHQRVRGSVASPREIRA